MSSRTNGRWIAVALLSLSAGACYKSVDYTKLKCLPDGSGCPTGYSCSPVPGADHGTCVPGIVAPDGSRDDVPTSTGPDGSRLDGGAGGSETGTSVFYDARRDGAGGAGGSDAAHVGGAGGAGGGDGPSAGAGGSDVPIGPSTGTPCQSAADCGSGYCVDGVCCDSACAGQCQSCKEVGSVGQCKPVKGAPIGGRPACGGTGICQSQCDGIHGDACAYPDSTTVCAPASCAAGKVTTASVCDTAGACSTPAISTCPGSQCATDGSAKCATACTATSCGAGAYCDTTGACLPTQPAGASCSAGAQCASGYCVDGICCDGKCDGQCESCKETGSVGKCKAVTGAPLATRTACGGTGVCKGNCDGTNGKACAFPDSASICTPASCTDGKATTASVCNGSGACTTPATSQCLSNLCGTDGKCSGSCTATSCAAGTYCDSTGSCVKTLDLGASCSSGTQCTSGLCVDGVCCNGKCDGQCQSCKATGSVGACKAIQGAPVSPRAACGGTGKCTAQCDGANAAACTYPDSSTVCTAASCAAGKVTTASVCNSSGSCTAATTNACDSNLCAADGVSCAGSCTPTSCATGTYCGAGGACTPTIADGRPCSGDNQCTHGHCVSGVCCATTCGTCYSCTTGTCVASSAGTTCSTGTGTGVCTSSQTCVSCTDGASCTGPANDPCHKYAISCSAGAVCQQNGNQPAIACGPAPSCSSNVQYAQAYCSSGTCPPQVTTSCANGCSGSTCLTCPTGSIGCGGACCNTTANYCSGTTCTPKPGSGQPCSSSVPCASGYTCSNGYCCGSGLTGCGLNNCVNTSTNTSNCGTCGNVCSSVQTCSGGTCQSLCQGGVYVCSSCLVWNFDDGTTQGWSAKTPNCSVGVAAGTGKGAYSLNVSANSSDGADIDVTVSICRNGAAIMFPTKGYRFNGDVQFRAFSDFGDAGGSGAAILVEGESYYRVLYSGDPIAANQWVALPETIITPQTPTGAIHLTLRFFPYSPWSGNIYIDNVTLNEVP